MTATPGLLEFLEESGAQVRVYDMGRRVAKISRNDFLKFERTEIPYSQPLRSQAWLALSISDTHGKREPLIWFLRLPLDEQGKLLQASRDYFLHRLLEAALEKPDGPASEKAAADAFKDNPYVFKPRADRMAVIHAKLSRDLNQPASRFLSHARDYFLGKVDWDQWSFVGYQGIADIAARIADQDTEKVLVRAIPRLPDEPLVALCHCLENEPLPLQLSGALRDRLSTELANNQPDISVVTALIRGLSNSISQTTQQHVFDSMMSHPLGSHIEVLAAISGRAWEQLKPPRQMARYLELLASNTEDQAVFNEVITDLLRLPGLRKPVLEAVRDPARSDTLASRFQALTREAAEGTSRNS